MAGCEGSKKIRKLLEKFTTANNPEPVHLKQIKSICKRDEQNVVLAFEAVLAQLSKSHSVVRMNCLQVVDQLFHRSHRFRTLLIENFHQFSILTLGYEANKPLPPPQSQHKKLRTETIGKIKEWHRKFKSGYKELDLAFNVLKEHVDFQEICLINDSDRRRRLEEEERLNNIWRERVQRVGHEFADYVEEIHLWSQTSDNLFNIISNGNCLANYEDELEDQYNILIKRLLPKVESWVVTLTKAGNLTDSNLLRQSVDLKQKLTESLQKFSKFNINSRNAQRATESIEKSNSCGEVDPTTWDATVLKVTGQKIDLNLQLDDKTDLKTNPVEAGCSSSSHIPRLEEVQFPDQMTVDPEKSRFWVSDGREGEVVSVGSIQRVTEFVDLPNTNTESSSQVCGAPLPSGGLCPRRDKVKCPLHGLILKDAAASSDSVTSLTRPEKKKIKRKTLKAAEKYDESSRSRIEKKIFNKSSARRVAKDLKQYDKIRTKNKFTDQFNY